MAYGEGHPQSSDGPTCLVALLAPFLVLGAIVGYVTLDRGGVRQQDENTGSIRVLTWHGWEPAGEPARQLSAPPAPASGADPTTAPLPTPLPAPPAALVAPTVDNAAPAPAARSDSGAASRYAGYSAVEPADPTPAAPAAPAGLSPWTVLGWILLGLVPLLLLTGAALIGHRYLTSTRRRVGPGGTTPVLTAETLAAHVVGATATGPAAPPAGGAPEENAPPGLAEQTYIADFLRAERRPEMVAVGGTHDAPVAG